MKKYGEAQFDLKKIYLPRQLKLSESSFFEEPASDFSMTCLDHNYQFGYMVLTCTQSCLGYFPENGSERDT